MKFGSCVWTFRWATPYEDAVQRIAALGFKGVELIAWDRKTLDEYYTRKRTKNLRELVEASGLEVTEFVSTPRGMASLKKEDKRQALDHFTRLVEVATELGTTIVNTVSPWPFNSPAPSIKNRPLMQTFLLNIPYNQDMTLLWESYVDLMKQFAAVVERAGLRYAIEPHPFRIVSNVDSMLRLIDHVGSKAIGMNWDPSHLFPSGETPAIGILKLKDRVFHTHLSDNDALTNCHWRPGTGKIDWRSVLKALKAIGYNSVLSFELEDAPGASHRIGPEEATSTLDEEHLQAKAYLTRLARDLNIPIETD